MTSASKSPASGGDWLDAAGSEQAAKGAGKVRVEDKVYFMSDGDVVEFRFNL